MLVQLDGWHGPGSPDSTLEASPTSLGIICTGPSGMLLEEVLGQGRQLEVVFLHEGEVPIAPDPKIGQQLPRVGHTGLRQIRREAVVVGDVDARLRCVKVDGDFCEVGQCPCGFLLQEARVVGRTLGAHAHDMARQLRLHVVDGRVVGDACIRESPRPRRYGHSGVETLEGSGVWLDPKDTLDLFLACVACHPKVETSERVTNQVRIADIGQQLADGSLDGDFRACEIQR